MSAAAIVNPFQGIKDITKAFKGGDKKPTPAAPAKPISEVGTPARPGDTTRGRAGAASRKLKGSQRANLGGDPSQLGVPIGAEVQDNRRFEREGRTSQSSRKLSG